MGDLANLIIWFLRLVNLSYYICFQVGINYQPPTVIPGGDLAKVPAWRVYVEQHHSYR